MAYILNIDTSAKNCSVALQNDATLVAAYDIRLERSASSLVNVYCERLLSDAGLGRNNLAAIAVSIGPGSYTGLRIAVSTAKGWAAGLDLPLISVDTLEAMASSQISLATALQGLICPMLDARRMEVFTRLYNADLQGIQPTQALILDENVFADLLQTTKIIFMGDGSTKLKPLIETPNALFVPDVCPSAHYMIGISWAKYCDSVFADVAYLEPYYLKEFMTTSKTLS